MGNPVGIGIVGTLPGIFIDRCNGVGHRFGCHIFTLIRIFARPWCNYFCPTGALLDILRKADTKAGSERRKKVIREFIALAIFLVILYFILR